MKSEITANTYAMGNIHFVKAYIVTMRPYLMFVSGITGLTGISLVSGNLSLVYVLIFISSFLSYGFGQALTDCFQIDTDSISSPYRPLTRGIVSKNLFMVISATGLLLCVAVFAWFDIFNLFLGLAAGAGLATYTYFKRKWWSGPFYNSIIVGILFLMSYYSAATEIELRVENEITFTLLTVFFGYSNFVLSGYFKDISADKATGYNTLPVRFGRKISAAVSDVFALSTLIFSLQAIEIMLPADRFSDKLVPAVFLIAGIFYSILGQLRLHKVNTDNDSFRAIICTVHSYILLLSSIISAKKPEWSILLIIYYLLFQFVLSRRPSKYQI